jgi:single-strand DNA-binding protein
LLGNLVRDVEVSYTPSGTAVGKFALAVNERVKKGDEWTDEVSYFDIVTSAKTAEACANNIGKGSPVLVSGRAKQNRWEAEGGAKRSRVEFIAENVQFLGKRKEEGATQETPQDDIPF